MAKLREHEDQREKVEAWAPDDYKSRVQLRDEWGVHIQTIAKAVDATREEIGEILRTNRSNNPTDAFSPTQQAVIYAWLEENNFIASKVPEGYMSVGAMSSQLRLGGEKVITRAINELGEALGSASRYKNYSRITDYYSQEQQQQIREWIIRNLPKSKLAQSAIAAANS